jgi:hypothetical protein
MKKEEKTVDETVESAMKKSAGFFSWVQEFSKKIVAVTFLIFVVVNIFIMVMAVLVYYRSGGEVVSLDTLLSEVHTTFRDVIGGYIIKAATENVLKIGGGIFEKYLGNKIEQKQMDIDNSFGGGDFDCSDGTDDPLSQ